VKGDIKINGDLKDLYSDYFNLIVQDMSKSNELYHTYVEEDIFTDKLKLTLD
jgi:hypothetical protein